jgi:hypothetical protein
MSEVRPGLTVDQARELRQLADQLRDKLGNNISQPDVLFGQHVANYFTSLAIDSAAEKISPPPAVEDTGISMRMAAPKRMIALVFLQRSLGRSLVPADLLDRLKPIGPVEDAVAEALRRDIEEMNG